MSNDENRLNVIHQSLVRPILVMGAERPLAIALWVTVAGLLLPWKGLETAIVAVLMATAGHGLLVYLAKIDSQFSQVYIRHWRYRQDYYPARGSIWVAPVSHVGALITCWGVATLVAVWLSILIGHQSAVLGICAAVAAYCTWKIVSANPIRPTIPLKVRWI